MAFTVPKFVLFLLIWTVHNCRSTQSDVPTLELSVPSKVYIAVGRALTANCSIVLNQPIQGGVGLIWTYQGHPLASDNGSVVTLEIDHVTPGHSGVYVCLGVSGVTPRSVIAATSFAVDVGERPARPSPPTIHHLYGYPSNDGALSYQTLPITSTYPVTYELLLSPNGCYDDPRNDLRIAHAYTTIQRDGDPAQKVLCDISERLRRCDWTKAEDCPGFAACWRLLTKLRATNVFGSIESDPTGWLLDSQTKCGSVSNLRVSDVQQHTVTLSWTTPRPLINSTSNIIIFKIQCSPNCSEIEYRSKHGLKPGEWHYTISSLQVYTQYTFRVFCALRDEDISPRDSYASITVWTNERVPRSKLRVQECRSIPVDENKRNVRIEWKPLLRGELQGRLQRYVLTYRDLSLSTNKNISQDIFENVTSFTIEGLSRKSNYSISVSVCVSVGCSEPSFYSVYSDVIYPSPEAVVDGHPSQSTTYVLPLVLGIIFGLLLAAAFYVFYTRRRRQQQQRYQLRPKLPTDLKPVDIDELTTGIPDSEDYYDAIVPDAGPGTNLSRTSSSHTSITII